MALSLSLFQPKLNPWLRLVQTLRMHAWVPWATQTQIAMSLENWHQIILTRRKAKFFSYVNKSMVDLLASRYRLDMTR